MAEFVEKSLEQLLSVFELLRSTQLLKKKEVSSLVKHCRRHDYKLQKRSKRPEDFVNYANYLCDLLQLIHVRRSAREYHFKKKKIERTLQLKACSIYRHLCERFKGEIDYWKMYIKFAEMQNMKSQTSKAYVYAIQMHPHCVELRVDSALFEFFKNASIDNARHVLQLALRTFPGIIRVWETLLRVEIGYVKRLRDRQDVLLGKRKGEAADDEGGSEGEASRPAEVAKPSDDVILQLKVAEVVVEQAVAHFHLNLPEQEADLLLSLWECSHEYGEVSQRITEMLEEMLKMRGEEASWKLEFFKRRSAGESVVDVMDSALERNPSASVRRFFISLCDKETDDALCLLRVREQLQELLKCGEASEEEFDRLLAMPGVFFHTETLRSAIKQWPRKADLWMVLLEKEEEELGDVPDASDVAAFIKKINSAIQQVDAKNSLELYKFLIDFTIARLPQHIEKTFKRSIDRATGEVRGELKALRVEYLVSLAEQGQISEQQLETQLLPLLQLQPNTESFYLSASSFLHPFPSLEGKVLETAVLDVSSSSIALWLKRAQWLLQQNRPLEVASVHKRALLSLQPGLTEDFIHQFTALQQRTALMS